MHIDVPIYFHLPHRVEDRLSDGDLWLGYNAPELAISKYVDILNCSIEKLCTARLTYVLIKLHGIRVCIFQSSDCITHIILKMVIILMHGVIITICLCSAHWELVSGILSLSLLRYLDKFMDTRIKLHKLGTRIYNHTQTCLTISCLRLIFHCLSYLGFQKSGSWLISGGLV